MTQTAREAYLSSLPKKISSAGVLFFNEQNQFLLVEPTYKDNWDIPGGIIEANESPRDAAIREIKEEIDLTIDPGALLVIDYKKIKDSNTDSYQLIFDGGVLTDEQIALIRVDGKELKSCSFVDNARAMTLLRNTMQQRIKAAQKARHEGKTFYMEYGQII